MAYFRTECRHVQFIIDTLADKNVPIEELEMHELNPHIAESVAKLPNIQNKN